MTVLKIDASARSNDSNSRALTQYLAEQLGQTVVERDVAQQPLPLISAEDLINLHGSNNLDGESIQQHLALSTELIAELKNADTLIIGSPMYNFGVPVALKQWIDYVCRAGQTFSYTAEGPKGLTGIQRAFIVTATGGTPVGSPVDHVSTYLEQVCRFVGVEEIIHIDAGGSKRSPEKVIEEGKQQIDNALQATANKAELETA